MKEDEGKRRMRVGVRNGLTDANTTTGLCVMDVTMDVVTFNVHMEPGTVSRDGFVGVIEASRCGSGRVSDSSSKAPQSSDVQAAERQPAFLAASRNRSTDLCRN